MNLKAIFYILSILVIGAAAYFGYTNSGKIKEQIDVYEDTSNTKKSVEKTITKTSTTLEGTEVDLESELMTEADRKSELDTAMSKFGAMAKTLAAHQTEIMEADKDLADLDKIQKEVNDLLPAGIDNWDQVPDEIEKLKDKRKLLSDDLANLTKRNGNLTKEVSDKKTRLSEDSERLAKMRRRIALNSKVGAITSVNNDFGFVVVNLGDGNSNITAESELLVTRAGRLVGRLKPSSVEKSQTVCDLNARDIRAGIRIQPGDRVILAQTVGGN